MRIITKSMFKGDPNKLTETRKYKSPEGKLLTNIIYYQLSKDKFAFYDYIQQTLYYEPGSSDLLEDDTWEIRKITDKTESFTDNEFTREGEVYIKDEVMEDLSDGISIQEGGYIIHDKTEQFDDLYFEVKQDYGLYICYKEKAERSCSNYQDPTIDFMLNILWMNYEKLSKK